MIKTFDKDELKNLWKPENDSSGEDNGQIVIIGGSELFTGAPLLSLVAASRLVDMVFLATPEADREAAEKAVLFSKLKSVIWIPRNDLEAYMQKADAILIGPGMMRYHSENPKSLPDRQAGEILSSKQFDEKGTETRMITQYLLTQFPEKRWVIDGGSLQVIEPKWLPPGAVITPNMKEFELLFKNSPSDPSLDSREGSVGLIEEMARKYSIVICYKGPTTYVSDGETTYEVHGGNAGLTKGGTGDVLAGVTVGLLAKNDPLFAVSAASLIVKKTAEYLYEKVGFHFNADDVAEKVFETWKNLV